MDPPSRRTGWAQGQISSWSQRRSSAIRSSIRSVTGNNDQRHDPSGYESSATSESSFGPTRSKHELAAITNCMPRFSHHMPTMSYRTQTNSTSHSAHDSSPLANDGAPPQFLNKVSQYNNENTRSIWNHEADMTPHQHQTGIPKSKTFSVFYSITQSISNSRIISTSTRYRSQTPPPDHAPHRPSAPVTKKSIEPLLAEEETVMSEQIWSPPPLPDNPRLVKTAMPPEYWAGRFMALHDKFHNELLMPQNLEVLLEAQSAKFSLQAGKRTPSVAAAAQNNPSVSAYSVTRIAPGPNFMSRGIIPSQQQKRTSAIQTQSRIPQSATSGAILQTTPHCSTRSSSRTYTPYSGVTKVSSSRPPSYDQGITKLLPCTTNDQGNTTLPIMSSVSQDIPPEVPRHRYFSGNYSRPATHSMAARRALANNLEDEDARCKRVFIHLEALCVTEDARESLKRWQAAYARKMKRGALLPVGERMMIAILPRASGRFCGNMECEEGGEAEEVTGGLLPHVESMGSVVSQQQTEGGFSQGKEYGGMKSATRGIVRRLRRSFVGGGGGSLGGYQYGNEYMSTSGSSGDGGIIRDHQQDGGKKNMLYEGEKPVMRKYRFEEPVSEGNNDMDGGGGGGGGGVIKVRKRGSMLGLDRLGGINGGGRRRGMSILSG